MVKAFGVLAAVCAAAMTATPALAAELTPEGPATLMNRYTGAHTLEGTAPQVLTAVRIVVGEGGREGMIRVRALGAGGPLLGDPVLLPATPGTYTFPAPHVGGDYRSLRLGIEQTTGGHAIIAQQPCRPDAGEYSDPCRIHTLEVFRGDPTGVPTERLAGLPLTISPITETDLDQDRRADQTEDRTDLALSAAPSTRGADGRLRTAVTVTNHGPLAADLLTLESPPIARGTRLKAEATANQDGWESACLPLFWSMSRDRDQCTMATPVAPGESRSLTYVSAGAVELGVRAEGPDLAPADNVVRVSDLPVSPTVAVVGEPTLRRGLNLTVAGEGRTRVTAAFQVRGTAVRLARTVTLRRDVARTVKLKAGGAKLRTLRRAAARRALRATITVHSPGGATATATARVR